MDYTIRRSQLCQRPAACVVDSHCRDKWSCSIGSKWRFRARIPCAASPDDKQGQGSGRKADASSYWAIQFRNLFSNRRKYLEGKDPNKEPEMVTKLKDTIEKAQKEIDEIDKVTRDRRSAKLFSTSMQVDRKLDSARGATKEAMASMKQTLSIPEEKAPSIVSSYESSANDTAQAKAHLRSGYARIVVVAGIYAQSALRNFLLAPVTLFVYLHKRWSNIFASASYERFLLSEGENMWFWRNRTENERWFWEIFLLERILIPTAGIVMYEYLVPNNVLWSVVLPISFFIWQNERFPDLTTVHFWMVAYFGFYLKCLPGLLLWWHGMFG